MIQLTKNRYDKRRKELAAARVIKEEIGMSEHSIPRVAEIIDWCLTWKDQQFKEYLEKKILFLESQRRSWNKRSNRYIAFDIAIINLQSIINELFGE